MIYHTKLIGLVMVGLLALSSCKKDVEGCTDETADNYMVNANIDDGSCEYHGHLSFWYDMESRDSLISNNVASVSAYVDGEVVQNFNTSFSLWSEEPECSTSAIGDWIKMVGTKTTLVDVEIIALDSANLQVRTWNTTLTSEHNTCDVHEIVW